MATGASTTELLQQASYAISSAATSCIRHKLVLHPVLKYIIVILFLHDARLWTGNPCNANGGLLMCVIHPASLGSGTENPAPSNEKGRSLEK